MKVLHKIFSVHPKTLDKATLLGIVGNYIREEATKKSWETQMFGKRCSENLSKIHSEPCQTSNMEIFVEIVNYQKTINYFRKKLQLRWLIGL